jgi:hypothetical protein
MLSEGKYSFHKLSQFSQLNNVIYPPASDVNAFLTRDIVLLSFT